MPAADSGAGHFSQEKAMIAGAGQLGSQPALQPGHRISNQGAMGHTITQGVPGERLRPGRRGQVGEELLRQRLLVSPKDVDCVAVRLAYGMGQV